MAFGLPGLQNAEGEEPEDPVLVGGVVLAFAAAALPSRGAVQTIVEGRHDPQELRAGFVRLES